MNASQKGAFYYHACANPIGGTILEPMRHVLSAQGSAALAQAGGHATGAAGPHRFHDIVAFETAHSEAYGSEADINGRSYYVSHVVSVLEDLNVLGGKIKADEIVAKITVRHPHDGGHPSVSFRGTRFTNLTIEGKNQGERLEVLPDLDLKAFARSETHAGRDGALPFEHEPEFKEAAAAHYSRLAKATDQHSWIKRRYKAMETGAPNPASEVFVCSLVKAVSGSVTSQYPTFGHIIHVPGVGNLILGELCASHRMFRVTMLRLELGCEVRGEMSCASADSNGSTMPI